MAAHSLTVVSQSLHSLLPYPDFAMSVETADSSVLARFPPQPVSLPNFGIFNLKLKIWYLLSISIMT
jgi:hypothetical protein